MGKQSSIETLELNADDDIIQFRDKVRSAANKLDTGKGVIVLTDLLGGSPYNVTAALIKENNWESITGVNLPMLMEAISSREFHSLSTLAQCCYDTGMEGIKNVRNELQDVLNKQ